MSGRWGVCLGGLGVGVGGCGGVVGWGVGVGGGGTSLYSLNSWLQ